MSSGMNDKYYEDAEIAMFGKPFNQCGVTTGRLHGGEQSNTPKSKELPMDLPSKYCDPVVANYYRGKIIVLEGLDRTGKSTQAELLTAEFQKAGVEVHSTHFPSGGSIGKSIYTMLNAHRKEMTEREIWINHLCAHFCDIRENIVPALQAGKVVIADRWITSAVVYNGMTARAFDPNIIAEWETFAVRGLEPEVLFYFTSPSEAVSHNKFLMEADYNYRHLMSIYGSDICSRGYLSSVRSSKPITVDDWRVRGIEGTLGKLFCLLAANIPHHE